ncbi:MAG TPA: hypothetical protein VHW02_12480 [Rhizomicrobium sp.]|jgi:hypothetical protein|nr:hypothetical protein [Rhizomicrobium sp.]
MPVPDFAQGVKAPFFAMIDRKPWTGGPKTAAAANTPASTAATDPASPAPAQTASSAPDISFDDLIDIANPLQHFPVVSTLYRAISGDQIGDPEKVIGDTIYGGPMGLASSLADLAFKHFTGKDFGDTVLAMVTGDDSIGAPTAVASAKPSPAQTPAQTQVAQIAPFSVTQPPRLLATLPALQQTPAAPIPAQSITAPTPDLDALNAALKRSGIDADTSARAALAYQQSMLMAGIAQAPKPN